jgi:predicted nucleic acid-binding protein
MTSPVFIDTNVPIYAGGAPHPLQAPCRDVLGLVALHPRAFWTSAEVLQELLHRYLAIGRWGAGQVVFDGFTSLMRGRIESILPQDVASAAGLIGQPTDLQARDLLHLAVMKRMGADTLVSADRGFDRAPDVRRLDPANLSTWRDQVVVSA